MKFKKKYEEKKFSSKTSLALEIGNITHKGKELVAEALIRGEKPDYAYIKDIVEEGFQNPDNKRNPFIAGIKELKERYFEEWVQEKSGQDTYDKKLELYFKHLPDLEHNSEWVPIACEFPFDFMFNDTYRFTGFIDELEENKNGGIRIIDYKSSKKMYTEQEIKTPLQMVIYTLGIVQLFNKLPVEHVYDFMLLGQTQLACSKGYLKRGTTKLTKIFAKLEQSRFSGIYAPNPSPLCHWCDYCETNLDAEEKLKYECPYHSLWTPNKKSFDVKQKYNSFVVKKTETFWF